MQILFESTDEDVVHRNVYRLLFVYSFKREILFESTDEDVVHRNVCRLLFVYNFKRHCTNLIENETDIKLPDT